MNEILEEKKYSKSSERNITRMFNFFNAGTKGIAGDRCSDPDSQLPWQSTQTDFSTGYTASPCKLDFIKGVICLS